MEFYKVNLQNSDKFENSGIPVYINQNVAGGSFSKPTVNKTCCFKGCITKLEQSHIKERSFCHLHEKYLTLYLEENLLSDRRDEFLYYKSVLDNHNRYVRKKSFKEWKNNNIIFFRGRYIVKIPHRGRKIYLGSFKTIEKAQNSIKEYYRH